MAVARSEQSQRSEQPFAAWVEPHLPAMQRYGDRLAGADGEDVVQDALVRAWRRWPTYDATRGEPLPWLLAIVADRARHRRRSHSNLGLLDSDATTGTPLPDLDLERAVAALPRRQRQAIDLYYYLDLDIAAVVKTMRCAPGTVRATLHQARESLRSLLGDDDG